MRAARHGARHGGSVARRRGTGRGQSLVEFTLLLPVFLLLLTGMLDFGMAFDHLISISYASREGARTGAALVNGGGTLGCQTGQSPNADTVDDHVIAAVERVLTSPGSRVELSDIRQIRIFRANSSGGEMSGVVNVWTYTPESGPVVEDVPLDFSVASTGWPACQRTDALPAQSIGVSIDYRYRFATPLGTILELVGGAGSTGLDVTDRAVMAMNPTR